MRKIKLKNIFVLDNILTTQASDSFAEIVTEHHQKKQVHRLFSNDYKPGSPRYEEIEQEKAKILAYPDHDIKYIDTIELTDSTFNSSIDKSFELGVYTYEGSEYDYSTEESYPISAKIYFLVDSQFSSNPKVYTSVADLLSKDRNILYKLQEEAIESMFYELKESYEDEYRKYFLLLKDEIIESLSQGYEVRIDQAQTGMFTYGPPFIEIKKLEGSKIYHLSLLDKILAIDYYWDNDRKERFGRNYRFKSVMEEYEFAKDNLCEEEPNDKS